MEIKDGVCQVVEELEWNSLQTSEWKKIESIVDLIEPFAEYTQLCCGESYTTLSAVIPIILELNYHLKETQRKPGMSTVAKALQVEMHRRFNKYINLSSDSFDGLQIAATLLDPVEEGKCYLKDIVSNFSSTKVNKNIANHMVSNMNHTQYKTTVYLRLTDPTQQ